MATSAPPTAISTGMDTGGRALHHRRAVPILLLLAGIVVAAAALRFYCLDCQGLWYDEVSSIDVAKRGLAAIFTGRFGWMRVQTPLHYLLAWLTLKPVDPTTTAVLVRLPSAVAGLLTPLVVYGLGRELFGRAQGLLAALLVALSAVHISHSQDVRPYVFLALLTALSTYCLLVAERTGEGRWWLAFGASTAANLLMTYHALTLALPALSPYILWVLYKAWRRKDRKQTKAIAAALLIIGGVAGLALVDLAGVPRIAPDLSHFTANSALDMLGRMLNRLGQVGLEREAEKGLQWAVATIAVLGALAGLGRRRVKSVLLCASMLLIPAILLAILRTTNAIFQRYVLFTMPFYFLLIANAVVALWTLLPGLLSGRAALLGRGLGGAVGAGLLLVWLTGLLVYFSPEGHRQLSFLPDYRGAARYLQQRAAPGDLIVLLDEPPQSMQTLGFYWHEAPPAPTYDAVDPRLPKQPQPRRIFWALNYQQNDPAYVQALQGSPGANTPARPFAAVGEFDRLLVLEEDGPGSVTASLTRMEARLAAVDARFGGSIQAVYTLQGSILQARGDRDGAARAYRQAGTYYPLGEEYRATAEGFITRGDTGTAWREAVMSKFMQPDNPRIHALLSQMLARAGFPAEAGIEQQLADTLGH